MSEQGLDAKNEGEKRLEMASGATDSSKRVVANLAARITALKAAAGRAIWNIKISRARPRHESTRVEAQIKGVGLQGRKSYRCSGIQ